MWLVCVIYLELFLLNLIGINLSVKQFVINETDYKVLISVYKSLRGVYKGSVTRKMIIEDSGVRPNTLCMRINNYYMKEKLLNEDKEIQ